MCAQPNGRLLLSVDNDAAVILTACHLKYVFYVEFVNAYADLTPR